MPIHMVTVISIFAGCGGSSLGYQLAGYEELLAVEWNAKAAATFRRNFPDVPLYEGDINELTVKECMKLAGVKQGELDVLDGSPPCQGFSISGHREYNDQRNSLFLAYVRLLKGLQPKVFVMENVTGLIIGVMKITYLRIVQELRECGYDVKGMVMNAQYYNVPQSRRRVIIIGVRNDLNIKPTHPKPQTKPINLRTALSNVEQTNDAHRLTQKQIDKWRGVERGKAHRERFSLTRLDWNKPAPTLLTASGIGGHYHPDEPRKMDSAELKIISSFPSDFIFETWHDAVMHMGNSVPPNLMRAIATHIKDNILSRCDKPPSNLSATEDQPADVQPTA